MASAIVSPSVVVSPRVSEDDVVVVVGEDDAISVTDESDDDTTPSSTDVDRSAGGCRL